MQRTLAAVTIAAAVVKEQLVVWEKLITEAGIEKQ